MILKLAIQSHCEQKSTKTSWKEVLERSVRGPHKKSKEIRLKTVVTDKQQDEMRAVQKEKKIKDWKERVKSNGVRETKV